MWWFIAMTFAALISFVWKDGGGHEVLLLGIGIAVGVYRRSYTS